MKLNALHSRRRPGDERVNIPLIWVRQACLIVAAAATPAVYGCIDVMKCSIGRFAVAECYCWQRAFHESLCRLSLSRCLNTQLAMQRALRQQQ